MNTNYETIGFLTFGTSTGLQLYGTGFLNTIDREGWGAEFDCAYGRDNNSWKTAIGIQSFQIDEFKILVVSIYKPCLDYVNRPGYYGCAIALRQKKERIFELSEPVLECCDFLEKLEKNQEAFKSRIFKGKKEVLEKLAADYWQHTSLPAFDLHNIFSHRPRRSEWRITSQDIWKKLKKEHLSNLISSKPYNSLFLLTNPDVGGVSSVVEIKDKQKLNEILTGFQDVIITDQRPVTSIALKKKNNISRNAVMESKIQRVEGKLANINGAHKRLRGRVDNLEGNFGKKILGYLSVGLLGGGIAAASTFAFIRSAPKPVKLNNVSYSCDTTQLEKLITQKKGKITNTVKVVLDTTKSSEKNQMIRGTIIMCLRDLAIFYMPKGKYKKKCDFRSIYLHAGNVEYNKLLREIKIALDPNCAAAKISN